jgi:hypothetical protein
MFFKQHMRVRVQNVWFEIVTAVSIKFRDLLGVTLCSSIRRVSTFRMNMLHFSSEPHDFDPEHQGSSLIWMVFDNVPTSVHDFQYRKTVILIKLHV